MVLVQLVCESKVKVDIDTDHEIGPVIVSKELIPDPAKLRLKGYKNGKVMQDSGCE